MRHHSFFFAALLASFPAGPAGLSAASYTPDVDRIILFVGQNVESIAGYVAATGKCPGGVMSYTSTAAAEGLGTSASYGTGLIDAQFFVNDPDYNNTAVQLGLYLDNDLANIIAGVRDGNLAAVGNWIRNAGRPVYLRIGYEFDAPWNALPPDQYVAAYRHVVDFLRANGVTNAAFVWHSACSPTCVSLPVSAWYPGDDYVDWAGISVFNQFDGTLGTVADLDAFCDFAKSKNKPVMIAESAPYGGISDARWTNWFVPCLDLIHRHHIQMWCYINTDWEAQPMFAGQSWGDTRIEQNAFVLSNWLAAVNDPAFLKQSAELFPRLHAQATNCWQEAEAARLAGTALRADASASGGQAATLGAPGSSATFTNAGAAVHFVLRYAAASNGTLGLYVNSQPRRSLPVTATGPAGGPGSYRDLLVHAAIPDGATVRLQFDPGDTAADLDFILFRSYEDADGDGLPDDWERWRFGSLIYGPDDDPDGDGSSNYAEFVADTDPMDAASALRITGLAFTANAVNVAFSCPPDRRCVLAESPDLGVWTFLPAPPQTNAAGGSFVVGHVPPGTAFFRLQVP